MYILFFDRIDTKDNQTIGNMLEYNIKREREKERKRERDRERGACEVCLLSSLSLQVAYVEKNSITLVCILNMLSFGADVDRNSVTWEPLYEFIARVVY